MTARMKTFVGEIVGLAVFLIFMFVTGVLPAIAVNFDPLGRLAALIFGCLILLILVG